MPSDPLATLTVVHGPAKGKVFGLHDASLIIGRDPASVVAINSATVSRQHASLRWDGSTYLLGDMESTNGTFVNGQPIRKAYSLRDGDIVGLGHTVQLSYKVLQPGRTNDPSVQPSAKSSTITISFDQRSKITIGRSTNNDVRLDSPMVSRNHAQIEIVGGRYCLRDLDSLNGTFVNDERIEGSVWLKPTDVIRIGGTKLSLAGRQLLGVTDDTSMRLEAVGLSKWVSKTVNLLHNVSLVIKPGELVLLVGLSGAGKSTLMDALAGYRPATGGEVTVNEVNLYEHFDAVRNQIGYVPQQDIIHAELTIFEALDYAARLRMPPDVTVEERHQRVEEVMAGLGGDLAERRDVVVSKISGGQKKRVSIGAELLTKPNLFFLDEPTSGLDAENKGIVMRLMHSMAKQGRTIILTTHDIDDVMLADKVIFLARGGYLAWFGPPSEAVRYFSKYSQQASNMEFKTIYSILSDSTKGTSEAWEARFRQSSYYKEYIATPLGLPSRAPAKSATNQTNPRPSRATAKRISSLRQFLILSARNLKILRRDRITLCLTLLTSWLLASFDFMITRFDMFDRTNGKPEQVTTTIFTLTIIAVFVGALGQMREFVKELDVYKRERLVGLKILPYVLSKVWVAILLALYQSASYLIIRYLAVGMPGGPGDMLGIYITVLLATTAGMMIGLAVSAYSPTANAAPLLTIIFLIPQILLGGGILPINTLGPVGGTASYVVSSRWAFESLIIQTGLGRDVANDPCWDKPEDERKALTDDYKAANCPCTGVNAFSKKCEFPGLRKSYDPAIDQPRPDPAAKAQEFSKWESARAKAIVSAESALGRFNDRYGYIYDTPVVLRWLAQGAIIFTFFILILVLQKRKDVI